MKSHFIEFLWKQKQKCYAELSCSFKQVLMTRELQLVWLEMHKIEIQDLLCILWELFCFTSLQVPM